MTQPCNALCRTVPSPKHPLPVVEDRGRQAPVATRASGETATDYETINADHVHTGNHIRPYPPPEGAVQEPAYVSTQSAICGEPEAYLDVTGEHHSYEALRTSGGDRPVVLGGSSTYEGLTRGLYGNI